MPSTITKTEEIRNLSKLQQLFYSCKEPNVWHTCGRVSNEIEKTEKNNTTLASHTSTTHDATERVVQTNLCARIAMGTAAAMVVTTTTTTLKRTMLNETVTFH